MATFFHWQGHDLLLNLYLQPGAKTNELAGEFNQRLKVRLTTRPVDNKANKHLITFLAQLFAVAPSRVEMINGLKQRNKRVCIYKPEKLPKIIPASTQPK